MKILLRYIENKIVQYQNYKILNYFKNKIIKRIVDVGGHHGEFYTAFIKNNINFESYLIFEPFPESYSIIDKINDDRMIKFNIGVGDKKSILEFNISEWETSNTFSKINQDTLKNKLKKYIYKSEPYSSKLEIQIDSLDNVLYEMNQSIDILKIDVEGFELNVLKGASNLFNSNLVKNIVIEFQREGSYYNYSPKEIEKYLDIAGFKLKKTYKILGLGIEDRIYENINY